MKQLDQSSSIGQISYIFKAAPRLRTNEIQGNVEQWYNGPSKWEGILVEDDKVLTYAELVGKGQGLSLGNRGFYGITLQDKLYHESSFLVNGTILTSSHRRDHLGEIETKKQIIKVSESLPRHIITILAETGEKILETARILKLPLEESI